MDTLKIHYYGELVDKTGLAEEEIRYENQTLSDLIAYLESRYNLNFDALKIAVNHKITPTEEVINLRSKDEIAILSAFAGG